MTNKVVNLPAREAGTFDGGQAHLLACTLVNPLLLACKVHPLTSNVMALLSFF